MFPGQKYKILFLFLFCFFVLFFFEFKSKISPFIKIKSNSIFSVHDVYGVKLLSRFRLNFSHLKMELTVCATLAMPAVSNNKIKTR